jgi:5-methylcytosine-specific restriction protein A
MCQAPGCDQAATDVDHIVSKAKGGTDAGTNLQSLCHSHHSMKTAREDGGFGRA